MGTHNGAVDHSVFVVGIGRENIEHPLPDPSFRPARPPRVHLDRVAEPLWQIAPWNACPVTIENCFDKQPVVTGAHTYPSFAPGQQVLDPLPLVVTQCIAAHRSAPIKLTA
jgi:hypothetical protein